MPDQVVLSGTVDRLFDFLDNNGGLTEEFLYQHQPTTPDPIPVYATNRRPIGRLDYEVASATGLTILEGPALIVARKGYAGRIFVVSDTRFIVQEDAYAILPKPEYRDRINLAWFAAHYTEEFQSLRTSEDGIGDFPRTLLKSRSVSIPSVEVQDRLAALYQRRDTLMSGISGISGRIQQHIMSQAVVG
ncbi:hypothetical protein [Sphingomonas jeddahensis]|uniref:hypothetical protein n=1 Tax=Sphingomonas jeddahensis TaxID=1915074 RepID=UPI0011819E34|nr:hypothetical protein [Sphingomonas jeddahensis]